MCALPTIPKRADFQHLAKNSQRWVTPSFICSIGKPRLPALAPTTRLGLVVTKQISKKAVDRNRAKRRLRALANQVLPQTAWLAGYDVVFIAKHPALAHDFAAMTKDLRWALKRLETLCVAPDENT